MIYDNILGTIGRTPIVRINRLAPADVTMYVKCEFFNPLSSVKDRLAIAHHRGCGAPRRAQARPDRRRGHLRQHRHRAGDGVRGQGLSVRRRHGRDLLRRAPQDHAHVRRQGDPDAGRRARHRHGRARPRSWRRSTAGSWPASSRTRPTRPITATPPVRKSCSDFAGKRLDYFVTGWGTGGTLTGAGECSGWRVPRPRSSRPSPRSAALLSGKPFAPHKIQGWTPDFVPGVLNRDVAAPHRDGHRRRGHRAAPARWPARKASSAASPPAPPLRPR